MAGIKNADRALQSVLFEKRMDGPLFRRALSMRSGVRTDKSSPETLLLIRATRWLPRLPKRAPAGAPVFHEEDIE